MSGELRKEKDTRLKNQEIVRLKKRGKRYEIACHQGQVEAYRKDPKSVTVEALFVLPRVYSNIGKGAFCTEKELEEFAKFIKEDDKEKGKKDDDGSDDDFDRKGKGKKGKGGGGGGGAAVNETELALYVVSHGDLQKSEEERQKQTAAVHSTIHNVAEIVAEKVYDPTPAENQDDPSVKTKKKKKGAAEGVEVVRVKYSVADIEREMKNLKLTCPTDDRKTVLSVIHTLRHKGSIPCARVAQKVSVDPENAKELLEASRDPKSELYGAILPISSDAGGSSSSSSAPPEAPVQLVIDPQVRKKVKEMAGSSFKVLEENYTPSGDQPDLADALIHVGGAPTVEQKGAKKAGKTKAAPGSAEEAADSDSDGAGPQGGKKGKKGKGGKKGKPTAAAGAADGAVKDEKDKEDEDSEDEITAAQRALAAAAADSDDGDARKKGKGKKGKKGGKGGQPAPKTQSKGPQPGAKPWEHSDDDEDDDDEDRKVGFAAPDKDSDDDFDGKRRKGKKKGKK